MNYKETGFRALYQHFCVFPMTGSIRLCMWDFPEANKADSVLTYGYVDQENGLTMEVLCAAFNTEDGVRLAEGSDELSAKLQLDMIKDLDFTVLEDENRELARQFSAKLKSLSAYDAPSGVEESRTFGFLDQCRIEDRVDDVLVYLMKDGFRPEGCRVRINGLGEGSFYGILLDQPYQDFGCRAGETLTFFVQKDNQGKIYCYADLTSSMRFTEEELEDGSLLRSAIQIFRAGPTNLHFLHVLEFLRDSTVWVPCTAVLSKADREALEQRIRDAEKTGGPEALVGKSFVNTEDVRMVPDILEKKKDLYLPVFSSTDEMGDYGDRFTAVPMHFLQVMDIAENHKRDLKGIIVDAFTTPFAVEKKLFSSVKNMNSRIETPEVSEF